MLIKHCKTFYYWYFSFRKDRSSHRRCSIKKDVLKNFAKFTRKHLRQSLFFNKVAGLSYRSQSIDLQNKSIEWFLYDRPIILSKKRLWHRCFLVNFAKFLRTPSLQNTSGDCFWKDYHWQAFLETCWYFVPPVAFDVFILEYIYSCVMTLTLYFPIFPFAPPENIRKPKVFWCFQGDQKGTLGSKGLIKI